MTAPEPHSSVVSGARRVRTPQRGHPVLRAISALVAVIASVLGAVLTSVIAAVMWSGCVVECKGENRAGGAVVFALAVVILGLGPLVVRALYRGAPWLRQSGWAFGVLVAVLLLWVLVG